MTTELPEEPRSRKEQYLADIAGQDVTLPAEPRSREEQYLAYIAENGGGGGGGGTTNFNQLTNRPRYNGTAMTGSTNIPQVKSYSAGNGLTLTGTSFSVDFTKAQGKFVTILTDADYDENNRIDITPLDAGWYLIKAGCEIYLNDSYTWELDCDNLIYKRINDIQLEDPTQIDYDAILYAVGVNLYSVSGEVGNEPDVYAQYFVTTEVTNNIAEQLHDAVLRGGTTPTTATEGKIGTLYETTDNGKLYICTAIDSTDPSDIQYTWTEVGAGGGGGTSMVKNLTSADYNYPVNNPTSVLPGLLSPGVYFISDDTVNVYDGNNTATAKSNEVFIVSKSAADATLHEMMVINSSNGSAYSNYKIEFFYVDKATGTTVKRGGANGFGLLDGGYIVDNVTTNSSKKVLSAAMGKSLNDKITKTPYYIAASALPAVGSTASSLSLYSGRNMNNGDKVSGQAFFNMAHNLVNDHSWKLMVVDYNGTSQDLELFLTAMNRGSLNAVAPSAADHPEAMFTFSDGTATRTLTIWTEDTGTDGYKYKLV